MPVHSVPADDLEAQIAELEKSSKIIAVTNAGDGAFVVITAAPTRRKAGEKETR